MRPSQTKFDDSSSLVEIQTLKPAIGELRFVALVNIRALSRLGSSTGNLYSVWGDVACRRWRIMTILFLFIPRLLEVYAIARVKATFEPELFSFLLVRYQREWTSQSAIQLWRTCCAVISESMVIQMACRRVTLTSRFDVGKQPETQEPKAASCSIQGGPDPVPWFDGFETRITTLSVRVTSRSPMEAMETKWNDKKTKFRSHTELRFGRVGVYVDGFFFLALLRSQLA